MRVNYAIVFVSDMKRSVAFYRDVIGLPLKFDSPEWSEFSTEGATLALHRAEHAAAAPHDDELPAGHCRPGLSVRDLDAFHARTRLQLAATGRRVAHGQQRSTQVSQLLAHR